MKLQHAQIVGRIHVAVPRLEVAVLALSRCEASHFLLCTASTQDGVFAGANFEAVAPGDFFFNFSSSAPVYCVVSSLRTGVFMRCQKEKERVKEEMREKGGLEEFRGLRSCNVFFLSLNFSVRA